MDDIQKYEAVEKVIDEMIRPYLIADGGNIELDLVRGNEVVISFQGACGSCPSSASGTLRGIERALRQQVDSEINVVPTNAYEAPRFGQEHPFGGMTYTEKLQELEEKRNNNT